MPDLVFDPEGIHRAVLNVVTNAIDAAAESEPPGRVEVAHASTRPSEALVRIVVDDNGPGIPADQMDHLFSPFVSIEEEPRHGPGAAGEPEDPQRARRPDPGPERARPRGPLHPRTARRPAEKPARGHAGMV